MQILGWFSADAACASRWEAGESLRILGYFIWQEFQGDEAMQLDIFGLVDDTYPPAAEFFDNAIVRDGLADHWAEILGPGLGQVNEGAEICAGKGTALIAACGNKGEYPAPWQRQGCRY